MNKKQLISAITILAAALSVEVVTQDLEVKDLEILHEKLTKENEDRVKKENENDVEFKANENVVLQFIRPYKRYSNEDIAGFDANTAERIMKLKPAVAVKYQEKSTEE